MRTVDTVPSAREILGEIAQRHEVDSAVAEAAEITYDRAETCSFRVIDTVTAEESAEPQTLTVPEYRDQLDKRTAMSRRHENAPAAIRTKSIPFVRHDDTPTNCPKCRGSTRVTCFDCGGSKTETCPNCDGEREVVCGPCEEGVVDCPACSGSGRTHFSVDDQCPRCRGRSSIDCPNCPGGESDCRTCRGKGVTGCPKCRGDGMVRQRRTKRCGSCAGSGDEDCAECSGTGYVPCEPCDAEGTIACTSCRGRGDVGCQFCDEGGQVVETVVGILEFTTSHSIETEADPSFGDFVESHDGEVTDTETPIERSFPERNSSTVFRKRIQHRTVPVRYVTYEHNGTEYDLAWVDGDVRYTDSPTSGSFLNNELDQWRREKRFQPRERVGVVSDFLRHYRTIGTGSLLGVAVGAAALLSTLFLEAHNPIPTDGVVAGFGAAWVAFAAYRSRRSPSEPWTRAPTKARYLALLVAYGAAGALVLTGDFSLRIRVAFVALCSAHWVAVCADRLSYEGHRIAHARRKRREFIHTFGPANQLRSKGVLGRLPDPHSTPSEATFETLALGVRVICLVPAIYYLALVALSGWGGFSVSSALSPQLAMAVPLAIAVLATVPLGAVLLRFFSTSL